MPRCNGGYDCLIKESDSRYGISVETNEIKQFKSIVKLGEYLMNDYLLREFDSEFGKLLVSYLVKNNMLGMAEYFLEKSKSQMLINKNQALLDLEQAIFYALKAQLKAADVYSAHITENHSLYAHAFINDLNTGKLSNVIQNISTEQSIENIQSLYDFIEEVLDALSPKVEKNDILQ